ncbi:MAG: lamin tail domain-containing protein [Bacteroidales bacterium]
MALKLLVIFRFTQRLSLILITLFFCCPLIYAQPKEDHSISPISKLNISRDNNSLNISWDALIDATNYRVVFKEANGKYAPDLIISEYLEGSSYNKYLEIYNGTDRFIDLDKEIYELHIYLNNSKKGNNYFMNGLLPPGATFVFAYESSKLTLPNGVSTSILYHNFNGDDALELTRDSVRVDLFGVIGFIGDFLWCSERKKKTQDQTLRRNPSIVKGDNREFTTGTFATALKNQWDSYPIDEVSDFGRHTMNISFVKGEVVDTSCFVVDGLVDGEYIISIVAYDSITGAISEEFTTNITLSHIDVDSENTLTLESGFIQSISVADGATLLIPQDESVLVGELSISYSDVWGASQSNSPTLWVDGELNVSNTLEINYALSANRWHFISLPFDVDSMRVGDNSTPIQGVDIRICSYDTHARESNSGRVSNFVDISPLGSSANRLIKGVGYIMAIPKDATVSFYASDSSNQLSISNRDHKIFPEYGGANSNDIHNGWNLVGNPFFANLTKASSLDWLAWDGYTYILNGEVNSLNSYFMQVDTSDPIIILPEWCNIYESSLNRAQGSSSELLFRVSDGMVSDACHLRLLDSKAEFYQIGRDMAKMFSLRSDVPQIYFSRWGYPMLLTSIDLDELKLGIPFEITFASSSLHELSLDLNIDDDLLDVVIQLESGEYLEFSDSSLSIYGEKGQKLRALLKAIPKPTSIKELYSSIIISSREGEIFISGLTGGEIIRVFDTAAIPIHTSIAANDTQLIKLNRSGLFIIQIASSTNTINERVWVFNNNGIQL